MASSLSENLSPENWDDVNDEDYQSICEMIGKKPQGKFSIVVRNDFGAPLVIENAPFFYDGTPMPTQYWLVDPELVADVSRIESTGGIKRVQEQVSLETIQEIHKRASVSRDKLIDEQYCGPRPTGGVGGTRKGVKCLHTHVANFLATKNDEVGQWTLNEIEKLKAENK